MASLLPSAGVGPNKPGRPIPKQTLIHGVDALPVAVPFIGRYSQASALTVAITGCLLWGLGPVVGRRLPLTFMRWGSAVGTSETPNLEIWGSALANLLLVVTAKSEV